MMVLFMERMQALGRLLRVCIILFLCRVPSVAAGPLYWFSGICVVYLLFACFFTFEIVSSNFPIRVSATTLLLFQLSAADGKSSSNISNASSNSNKSTMDRSSGFAMPIVEKWSDYVAIVRRSVTKHCCEFAVAVLTVGMIVLLTCVHGAAVPTQPLAINGYSFPQAAVGYGVLFLVPAFGLGLAAAFEHLRSHRRNSLMLGSLSWVVLILGSIVIIVVGNTHAVAFLLCPVHAWHCLAERCGFCGMEEPRIRGLSIAEHAAGCVGPQQGHCTVSQHTGCGWISFQNGARFVKSKARLGKQSPPSAASPQQLPDSRKNPLTTTSQSLHPSTAAAADPEASTLQPTMSSDAAGSKRPNSSPQKSSIFMVFWRGGLTAHDYCMVLCIAAVQLLIGMFMLVLCLTVEPHSFGWCVGMPLYVLFWWSYLFLHWKFTGVPPCLSLSHVIVLGLSLGLWVAFGILCYIFVLDSAHATPSFVLLLLVLMVPFSMVEAALLLVWRKQAWERSHVFASISVVYGTLLLALVLAVMIVMSLLVSMAILCGVLAVVTTVVGTFYVSKSSAASERWWQPMHVVTAICIGVICLGVLIGYFWGFGFWGGSIGLLLCVVLLLTRMALGFLVPGCCLIVFFQAPSSRFSSMCQRQMTCV